MSEKAKKPRGRPPTGETPKRYFRMSDDDYDLVCRAANAGGAGDAHEKETVSSFIRSTILAKAKRILKKNSGGCGS